MLLNLDAGERDDETEDLWAQFDLLNCACGGHAGDEASMSRVAAFCARAGTRLGAHPSYPDREGFGRRSPLVKAGSVEGEAFRAPGDPDTASFAPGQRDSSSTPKFLRDAVAEQCRALVEIAARHGVVVSAVKLHGALYHDATTRPDIAEAALRAASGVLGTMCLVVGPPSGSLRVVAQSMGMPYASEGFADRRTRADGSLVPRTEEGALITDPQLAAQQARRLSADVDTICIHADTPNAPAIARVVRGVLRG
jgi:UPF0271 protein